MKLRNERIDPAALVEEEKLLLDEWAKTVPGFVRDGAVDAEKYCTASTKILVVLKEVNGDRVGDLRTHLKKGGRAQTWNVVTRWIENIFNLNKNYTWEDLEDVDNARRKQVLQDICAINVKKTGGKDVADNKAVYAAAVRD